MPNIQGSPYILLTPKRLSHNLTSLSASPDKADCEGKNLSNSDVTTEKNNTEDISVVTQLPHHSNHIGTIIDFNEQSVDDSYVSATSADTSTTSIKSLTPFMEFINSQENINALVSKLTKRLLTI